MGTISLRMKETEARSVKPSDRAGKPEPVSLTASENSEQGSKPEPEPEPGGVRIPPILLEGDEAAAPPGTKGPEKFAVGPGQPIQTEAAPHELPEAYGTGSLMLRARDPGCLYAHWDLKAEERANYSQLSAQGHLRLRVHRESLAGALETEVHVSPQANHWFIPVSAANARYVAELGCQRAGGDWELVAASEPAVTPAQPVAEPGPVRFATLKFGAEAGFTDAPPGQAEALPASTPKTEAPSRPAKEFLPALEPQFPLPPPFGKVVAEESLSTGLAAAGEQVQLSLPGLAHSEAEIAPEEITGRERLVSMLQPAGRRTWTWAQERALAELIDWSYLRQEHVSSAEIEEVIRGELRRAGISSPGESLQVQPLENLGTISSMGAAPPGPGGFWLNVNAELVIYGATEPDAKVALDGQPIHLRPDGTFSCRFALPDGFYRLAIAAASAQGETRAAELEFLRASTYSGEVGSHPQEAGLKPPLAEKTS